MKFSCEKCGRSYVADEKVRGRAFKMKCKQCGNVIVVKPPSSGAATVPTPTPGTLSTLSIAVPAAAPASGALDLEATNPAAALEDFVPAAPDPFSLPAGDPFATPAADPFVRASRDDIPDPMASFSTPPRAEPSPLDDPFARAAEARDSGPAVGAVTTPRLSEADEMFADLAEEMRGAEASTSEQVAAPPPAATPPEPAPAAIRPAPQPAAPSAPPLRAPAAPPLRAPAAPKPSRAGLAVGAAAALVVVVAGAAWVALRPSDAPPQKPQARAEPATAARAVNPPERRAVPAPQPAPAPAPPPAAAATRAPALPIATESLPPAALADVRADEAAQHASPGAVRPSAPDRKREQKVVAKQRAPEPKPKPKPEPVRKVAPAPEPPKPEVRVAQVQVQRRRVAEPVAPAAVHPASPAPPLTSNADLPPLDEAMIEATVAKYERSFDACATAARHDEPQLALDGRKVVVTMTVNPNGKALYPTLDDVELSGSEFGKCVKRESARMVFPAFGGEPIRARVPLTLK